MSLICCDLSTPSRESTTPVRLSELRKFSVSQIHYDSLRIRSLAGLSVPRQEFQRIGIGVVNQASYTELATTVPLYAGEPGDYTMSFEAKLRFDSTKCVLPLVARYVYFSGDFTNIDRTIYTFSYPYASAHLLWTSTTTPCGGTIFQRTPSKTIISLAANSNIAGMDTYGGYLYVLQGLDFNPRKYTFDGVIVDSLLSIPAPMKNGDGIKFYNGFLSYVDYYKRIVGRCLLPVYSNAAIVFRVPFISSTQAINRWGQATSF